MSYRDKIKAKIKDPKLMKHGKEVFDKEFFGVCFKKYNAGEFSGQYKWFKNVTKFIERHVSFKDAANKRALEIGCGWGAFSKILKDRGFEVIATDISAFIIKKAKKIQKDIDFRVEDVEKGINVRGKFDFIFALEVLEHLKNPKVSLRNMKRKLKKGGTVVFSTPYPTEWSKADPTHISINYPKSWLSLGKALGFKKVSFKYATFIPFFYRYTDFFNGALPFKIDARYLNSTCFYFFSG